MKNAIRAFMKRPTTLVGILTAFMFQVIFSVIWMTAYDGVMESTSRLQVAIVNEDKQFGAQIADGLVQSLPFDVMLSDDLHASQASLDQREIHMVVHIPSDFSEKAADGTQAASLHYYINESNTSMTKSVMNAAAVQITQKVNSQAAAMGIHQMLTGEPMKMSELQALATAGALTQRVTSEMHATHPVQGMNNQMVPMMLVLASYVGAMIMGMNFEQSAMALRGTISRWQGLAIRSMINIAAAAAVALVGASLIAALGGQMEHGFLSLWVFQSLVLLAFMFTAQAFLYLFGMAGMLFNIIMLSLQLVSSGAMVPRELLSPFYLHLGDYLPASYAVEGLMSILFGGPAVGTDAVKLVIIVAAAAAVSVLAASLKKQREPQLQPAVTIHSNHH